MLQIMLINCIHRMSTKGLNSSMVISLQKILWWTLCNVYPIEETHAIFPTYRKPFSKRFFYETKQKKYKYFNKC